MRDEEPRGPVDSNQFVFIPPIHNLYFISLPMSSSNSPKISSISSIFHRYQFPCECPIHCKWILTPRNQGTVVFKLLLTPGQSLANEDLMWPNWCNIALNASPGMRILKLSTQFNDFNKHVISNSMKIINTT